MSKEEDRETPECLHVGPDDQDEDGEDVYDWIETVCLNVCPFTDGCRFFQKNKDIYGVSAEDELLELLAEDDI